MALESCCAKVKAGKSAAAKAKAASFGAFIAQFLAGESGSWGELPVVNIDLEDGCSLMQVKS